MRKSAIIPSLTAVLLLFAGCKKEVLPPRECYVVTNSSSHTVVINAGSLSYTFKPGQSDSVGNNELKKANICRLLQEIGNDTVSIVFDGSRTLRHFRHVAVNEHGETYNSYLPEERNFLNPRSNGWQYNYQDWWHIHHDFVITDSDYENAVPAE